MTDERHALEKQIADALKEGEAIIAKVKDIQSWTERKNRPLEVHREIKRIVRETGDPIERRVALNYVLAEVKKCICAHAKLKKRILELDGALTRLNQK